MRSRQEFGMDSAKILQSPNNHPRITQESPKFVREFSRWDFLLNARGDVGLAWEYGSGSYNKRRTGADGAKREYGSGWYKKRLSDIVVKQSPVVLRRMGSNHRPSGYEPDELPLLYSAL